MEWINSFRYIFVNIDQRRSFVCVFFQSPTIICAIDGNFGLVRKKGAGHTSAKPYHQQEFFFDDTEVQEYMKTYDSGRYQKVQFVNLH